MNAIATTKTFEQKIFDRMRENIGELMSEEDLKKLLQATLDKMFFNKIERPDAYRYSGEDRYLDPGIYTLVRELIQPTMKQVMETWITDNNEKLQEQFQLIFNGQFMDAYNKAMNQKMETAFAELQNKLGELFRLNSLRMY